MFNKNQAENVYYYKKVIISSLLEFGVSYFLTDQVDFINVMVNLPEMTVQTRSVAS